MNKKIIYGLVGVVVVIIAVMALGGGGASQPGEVSEKMGADSLVAGAFSGSGSIKCEYAQEGGLVGTAYIKGGKVRIEGTINGGTANVIYGDDQVYNWGETNGYAYGFMMETPTADEKIEAGAQSLPSRSDIQNQFQGAGARCENYNAPDSLFAPPADVKFQNMSDLLKMVPKGY